tara:strand:+ start:804 stop:1208 length:405 start_codon:yes stop_codon:yes gene_type:complete
MSSITDVSNSEVEVDSSKEQLQKQEKQASIDRVRRELIAMVMRQTDYSEEVAIEKLTEYNGNYEKVIRDYLVGTPIVQPTVKEQSLNQRVFGEIRSYMDDASSAYYKKKEAMELRQLAMQQKQLGDKHNTDDTE